MKHKIKGGEWWVGDCLELMQDIPDGSVDMILTDPPYGTTACKWDSIIPFELMWAQLKRLTKDNGAIALFGGEPFSSLLRVSNIKRFKYDWVWDKVTARGHLVAKKRPMQQTELISVFENKLPHAYYPQMIDRPKDKIDVRKVRECRRTEIMGGEKRVLKEKVYDQWYPKNILKFSNANSSSKSIHPTQKPVALMEYLIRTYTNDGETVLDFTAGSGTTAVAAENTGRRWLCIERDETYSKVAMERIANHAHQGQLPLDAKK